ncbi:uncharacterized protein LOC131150788 [Malania oleifera]|uniref:uncharacterized protein LOC131150788 n=1 Tax=Malania oleifera TaxID=397392 RepID=UPI0025AE2B03|nr:uncharacterized protein LOC131150788 [Malania oleifera]
MASTIGAVEKVKETVEKAVNALVKWNSSKSKNEKPQLLDEDHFVYLVLTLKKIPSKVPTNPFKIPIPHPLHTPSTSELCLIIDDRPKSNLTAEAAKKKVKSEDIPISKVLRLSKLKTDYREYERKRKLCNSYGMFLVDKRIVHLLPRLLGKQFFKKKKTPVPVDLTQKNWKEQIERVCGSALLYLPTGTCSVVRVARASMEREDIVENVVAAINGAAEFVPKKWANVRSFHLKFSESLALPVYQALPDARLKIEGIKSDQMGTKEETNEKEAIKVKAEEKLGKKKSLKKGRIHEVCYMDNNVDELLGGDEVDTGGDESDRIINGRENDETGSHELGSKKRKKGGLMKESAFAKPSDDKKLKKLKNVKTGAGVKQKRDGLSLERKAGRLKNVEVKLNDTKRKKSKSVE